MSPSKRTGHQLIPEHPAAASLREFSALGQELLKQCRATPGKYARGVIRSASQELGLSISHLSAARQLAKRIDTHELEQLCQLVGPHGERLSACHLWALLVVKARTKRQQLAQRAVREGLSIRQFAVEVRRQVPKSARIGRHFRLPGDKTALLLQLQSLCERWQRYEDSYRLPRKRQAVAAWWEVSAEVEQAYETTWMTNLAPSRGSRMFRVYTLSLRNCAIRRRVGRYSAEQRYPSDPNAKTSAD